MTEISDKLDRLIVLSEEISENTLRLLPSDDTRRKEWFKIKDDKLRIAAKQQRDIDREINLAKTKEKRDAAAVIRRNVSNPNLKAVLERNLLNPKQRADEYERIRAGVKKIEEQDATSRDRVASGEFKGRLRGQFVTDSNDRKSRRQRLETEKDLAASRAIAAWPLSAEEEKKEISVDDVFQSLQETPKGGRKRRRTKKKKRRTKKKKRRTSKKKKRRRTKKR